LFVQHHGQRDRGRPELRRHSADRTRRLEGMATLHTTAAVGAAANRDVERPARRIRSFLYKKFFFVIFVNLRVFVVPSAVYYLREEPT